MRGFKDDVLCIEEFIGVASEFAFITKPAAPNPIPMCEGTYGYSTPCGINMGGIVIPVLYDITYKPTHVTMQEKNPFHENHNPSKLGLHHNFRL